MATTSTAIPSTHELQCDMTIARRVARTAAAAPSGSGVRLVYSTTPTWPFSCCSSSARASNTTTDIAVLDSSFNPPSRAHLALLLSKPMLAPNKCSYDAHLLLFSTQNADKGAGKPGDASLAQRVEMMTLLARHVERIQTAQGRAANVAVALVDKPLIFAKSTLMWDLVKHQHKVASPETEVHARLHWVVGFDTLSRVFQPKYYASLHDLQQQCTQFFERERTTFVCARRDACCYPPPVAQSQHDDADRRASIEEDKLLRSDIVAPWVERGSIAMLDLDSDQAKLSSTKIRSLLQDASLDDGGKRHELAAMVPASLVEYLVESGLYGARAGAA